MEERDPATTNGPITTDERTYAVELLHTTRTALHDAVAGITDARSRFKPTPEQWSVLENLEHIWLVERGIFRTLQAALDVPADPARRDNIKASDVFVIKAVRSRGRVSTVAPEFAVPKGRFADVPAALAAIDQQRTTSIQLAETAPDDLRYHYFEHFMLGTLDAYQTLLLIASHGERHRKQIDEVKASTGFNAE